MGGSRIQDSGGDALRNGWSVINKMPKILNNVGGLEGGGMAPCPPGSALASFNTKLIHLTFLNSIANPVSQLQQFRRIILILQFYIPQRYSQPSQMMRQIKQKEINNNKPGVLKATFEFYFFMLGQIPSSDCIQLHIFSKIWLLLCHSHIEFELKLGLS